MRRTLVRTKEDLDCIDFSNDYEYRYIVERKIGISPQIYIFFDKYYKYKENCCDDCECCVHTDNHIHGCEYYGTKYISMGKIRIEQRMKKLKRILK